MNIDGGAAEVQKAKDGILDKINNALSSRDVKGSSQQPAVGNMGDSPPMPSSGLPNGSGAYSLEMDVNEDAGIIIGAGGREITRLRDEFGVFADFNNNHKLVIRGKRENVERAKQEVLAKLDHAKRRRTIAPDERHWVEFRIPQVHWPSIEGNL